jgi:hypothetical protein
MINVEYTARSDGGIGPYIAGRSGVGPGPRAGRRLREIMMKNKASKHSSSIRDLLTFAAKGSILLMALWYCMANSVGPCTDFTETSMEGDIDVNILYPEMSGHSYDSVAFQTGTPINYIAIKTQDALLFEAVCNGDTNCMPVKFRVFCSTLETLPAGDTDAPDAIDIVEDIEEEDASADPGPDEKAIVINEIASDRCSYTGLTAEGMYTVVVGSLDGKEGSLEYKVKSVDSPGYLSCGPKKSDYQKCSDKYGE